MIDDCPHYDYCPQRERGDPRFVSALTRSTFALVLAGGRGTRLHQLTDWRAKPAVPFGGKFRIIDFTLSNCVNSGVRRIAVATQYMSHSLIQHLQRGWSFLDGRFHEFIEILPASQQTPGASWYAGTADAVFQNLNILRRNHPAYVLILSGDHVYKMDYGRMLAFHASRRAELTVACVAVPLEAASAFGVAGVDDEDRIVRFAEKPRHPDAMPDDPRHALASMGVYVFNAGLLDALLVRDAEDPHSSRDFGKDILPHCVRHHRVLAHRFADSCVNVEVDGRPYWRDVGTIDAYWEANMELTKVSPQLNLYDRDWPIWTYQEQLPPAKFVFDDDGRRGMAVDSLVADGVIVSGGEVRRSLLFAGVRVNSFASVEDAVLLPEVEVGRHARLARCVIDKKTRIPDGMTVGLDADADRRRFHVSAGGVTLVTPEMLGQQVFRQP
jgi:glucose-1-phosphate adenylyltransferase